MELNLRKQKYAKPMIGLPVMRLHTGREADIIISSFDSDFFQLISDRVSVLRYRGERSTISFLTQKELISLLLKTLL